MCVCCHRRLEGIRKGAPDKKKRAMEGAKSNDESRCEHTGHSGERNDNGRDAAVLSVMSLVIERASTAWGKYVCASRRAAGIISASG